MTLVFISYPSDALSFAKLIKEKLVDHGFEVFVELDNRMWKEWDRITEMNISKCDIFLIIITPESLQNKKVEKEVLYALDKKKLIIPCSFKKMVNRNQLKWGLNTIHVIEFNDEQELLRELDTRIENMENDISNEQIVKPEPAISKTIESEKQGQIPESMSGALRQSGPLARSFPQNSNKNGDETEETRLEKSSEVSLAQNRSSNNYYYEGSQKAKGTNLKIVIPIIGVVAAIFAIVLTSSGFLDPPSTTEPPTRFTTIQTFSFVTAWGSEGDEDGEFDVPRGIAVDSAGDVYVADVNNNRIQKFDNDGNFITAWGSEGRGNGSFILPWGIASDSDGNVYVTDFNSNRIQEFDNGGNFITAWGYDISGNGTLYFPYGSADGAFYHPLGIGIGLEDNVYIVDWGNHRVQKFDNNGNFITAWGSEGDEDGEFDVPRGIAVDSAGDVYVADVNNNRIQKFDNNGNFITAWGSQGSGDGEFNGPEGIAVDSAGVVYVTDLGNNRVQVFSPNT